MVKIVPCPWRGTVFAEKRQTCANVRQCESWMLRKTLKTPFDHSLWHPLSIPLTRAPSKRELQHGFGPAGCAVLLQTRFDKRCDCCPSGDLGGEECLAELGGAARSNNARVWSEGSPDFGT